MFEKQSKRKALVVLSGGQDSTTCLYLAMRQYEVSAITFSYGQRHSREIIAASKIAQFAGVRHEILTLPSNILVGSSPLISNNPLDQYESAEVLPGGLEKTFIPLRNALFLVIAANRAYEYGASSIYTGVCQADYGGYPDCRAEFIDELNVAINLGAFTGENGAPRPVLIKAPLMHNSKAQIVQTAMGLENCYEALALSHTGYDGNYPPTGKDHASLLREKGFAQAGIPDPLVLKAMYEDLMPCPKTDNYSEPLVLYFTEQLEKSGVLDL